MRPVGPDPLRALAECFNPIRTDEGTGLGSSKPDSLLVSLRGSLVHLTGWEALPVTPGSSPRQQARCGGSGVINHNVQSDAL